MDIEKRQRAFLEKNKTEILKFLNRVKLVSIALVAIFIAFVYLFIYRTMVKESQQALIDKFVETGNLNAHLLNNSIERAEESARSLSSRTMISEAIVDYLDGDQTLEELKSYTDSKYKDGAQALDNILYAKRVVGDESIAQYYRTNAAISKDILEEKEKVEILTTTIDVDKATAFIQSPIIHQERVTGEDHLLYDIKADLESLATSEMEVGLWCEKRHQNIVVDSQTLEANDHWQLFETASDYYAEYPIKDKYFYTKIAKSDLFNHLNIVVHRIIVGSLFIFMIASGIVYYFIVRSAKEKLVEMDESRREFKHLAYIDKLTEAYTRSFVEMWDQKYRDKDRLHSLVLIDLNDFKEINDRYGHHEGDRALRKVGQTLRNNLRSQDIVARYGGDEFVVILPDARTETSQKVMMRVEKQLADLTDTSIPITIAFGISSFRTKSLEEVIKEADQRMYQDKVDKKNQQK